MMNVVASAPGKLMIMGEYAVLEGAPSLVAAVDRRAIVKISPSKTGTTVTLPHVGVHRLSLPATNLSASPENHQEASSRPKQVDMVINTIETLLSHFGVDCRNALNVDFSVDVRSFFSSDNVKLGLGSSAAITVAVAAALNKNRSADRPVRSLFLTHALDVHRTQQTQPGSGADIAASTYGGFLEYRLSGEFEPQVPMVRPVDWPNDLFAKAVWTGKAASTSTFLSELLRFKQQKPGAYVKIMDQMADTAQKGVDLFRRGDVPSFLHSVDAFSRQLFQLSVKSDLPIITSAHARLMDIAHQLGGVYKPSGAGGGDVGIVFTDSATVLHRIQKAITTAGYDIVDLRWGVDGVTN